MWIILIFLDLISPAFSSFPAKITGCSASTNQGGYHCSESIDGDYVLGWVKADNGWAFSGVLPSNVEYTLETPFLLTQIRILTGMERPNLMITNFLIEVTVQILQMSIQYITGGKGEPPQTFGIVIEDYQ